MSTEDHGPAGEFALIARYFKRPTADPSVLIGSGDDAALVRPANDIALSTDTLVEGVHFLQSIAPERLAERALAVNLSDMAAMGAQPRWFTLGLTLPHTDPTWLENFAKGLHDCAARYDVSLVGGDLTAGTLSLAVHIAGEVSSSDVLTRAGAAPGDAVFVTGTPGDAAAGLQIARDNIIDSDDARYLLDRYELPTPRISAGISLRSIATAAIDVSDGLLADLGQICAASNCGARVNVEQLPLSEQLKHCVGRASARRFALSGGDDYELCFTAPNSDADHLEELLGSVGTRVTRIGECTSARDVECLLDGESFAVPKPGYEHFS